MTTTRQSSNFPSQQLLNSRSIVESLTDSKNDDDNDDDDDDDEKSRLLSICGNKLGIYKPPAKPTTVMKSVASVKGMKSLFKSVKKGIETTVQDTVDTISGAGNPFGDEDEDEDEDGDSEDDDGGNDKCLLTSFAQSLSSAKFNESSKTSSHSVHLALRMTRMENDSANALANAVIQTREKLGRNDCLTIDSALNLGVAGLPFQENEARLKKMADAWKLAEEARTKRARAFGGEEKLRKWKNDHFDNFDDDHFREDEESDYYDYDDNDEY